ncbi:MAG: response regulator [Deltaproteobacteria bacterium]|nr:MAG: response regulator [Deltaproteobacteria bacterium]
MSPEEKKVVAQRKVLIVNGNSVIRDTLASIVEDAGFAVSLASTGAEAQKIINNAHVDLVIAESFLQDCSGVELKRKILRMSPDTRVIVVNNFSVIKSSEDVLRFGASDYIIDQRELIELISHAISEEKAPLRVPVSDEGLKKCLIDVIDVLVGLLEVNDPFFGGNSHITMEYAKAVAEEMNLPPEMVDEIVVASLLHDIGKVGVKKEILVDKKDLTEKEYNSIKGHCENGVKILESIEFPWKVKPIILHHHERYDGNGYPMGLKGREIPLGARILAVVDAFTAMTANRPYRKALSKEDAIRELHRNVGTQFDPEVVEVFTRVIEKRFFYRGLTTRPRILVVDDEMDYLTLLKLKLSNEGFDVDAVDRGGDALYLLKNEDYDLVIMDVLMPDMTGIEVFQKMKESSDIEEIPVIFLSARDDVNLKVDALHLGAEDYLVKPIDMKELAARARNIIRRDQRRKIAATGGKRAGILGDLRNLSIPDIVQTLHLGLKTAMVTIKGKEGEAKIFFENGRVKHCEFGDLTGEDAFYHILRWTEGEFIIEHGVKTKTQTVMMDEMQMLMEGLRRLDEERRNGVN